MTQFWILTDSALLAWGRQSCKFFLQQCDNLLATLSSSGFSLTATGQQTTGELISSHGMCSLKLSWLSCLSESAYPDEGWFGLLSKRSQWEWQERCEDVQPLGTTDMTSWDSGLYSVHRGPCHFVVTAPSRSSILFIPSWGERTSCSSPLWCLCICIYAIFIWHHRFLGCRPLTTVWPE